jgi:hypothetical protein
MHEHMPAKEKVFAVAFMGLSGGGSLKRHWFQTFLVYSVKRLCSGARRWWQLLQ